MWSGLEAISRSLAEVFGIGWFGLERHIRTGALFRFYDTQDRIGRTEFLRI